MKIVIERVNNGYILTEEDIIISSSMVFTEEDLKGVLCQVLESLGETGSRHDEKRIYIVEAPGDKNDSFSEAHSKVLFGED